MDPTHKINEEQAALWNGVAGEAWVDAQALLDDMFRPFEAVLVDAVPAGASALDVGCGTGATTLAVARRAGATVGLDLSAPMIGAARARALRDGPSSAPTRRPTPSSRPSSIGSFRASA
jgi:2-polyprenyl-3-methyl-5-hydroxy-6-metoxy-1,4-benzoquinol methylase